MREVTAPHVRITEIKETELHECQFKIWNLYLFVVLLVHEAEQLVIAYFVLTLLLDVLESLK